MLILDALALDYEALVHFQPSAEERRNFASSGYAMPDGSFYIRPGSVSDLSNAISAVGRATPNAGESETARRNAVRRHIMKRARSKDINRPDMIPETWNSDGSLKQSSIAEGVEVFLAHYGVKGMKWHTTRGSRLPIPAEFSKEAEGWAAKLKPEEHQSQIERLTARLAELEKARREVNAVNPNSWEGHGAIFQVRARLAAVRKQKENADKKTAQARMLPVRRRTGRPGVLPPNRTPVTRTAPIRTSGIDDVEDFLKHYGVPGMRWGVRKEEPRGGEGKQLQIWGARGSTGLYVTPKARPEASPANHPSLNAPKLVAHPVSEDAARARMAQNQVSMHGTQALSNQDLQNLVTRLNLERQYSNLDPARQSAGRKFTQGVIRDAGKQLSTQFIVKNLPKAALFVAGAGATVLRKRLIGV